MITPHNSKLPALNVCHQRPLDSVARESRWHHHCHNVTMEDTLETLEAFADGRREYDWPRTCVAPAQMLSDILDAEGP
jgi:hypothetical protein